MSNLPNIIEQGIQAATAAEVARAIPAIEKAIKTAKKALQDHVRAGGIIEDCGEIWTVTDYAQEGIADHEAATQAMIDADAPASMFKVSKGDIVKHMDGASVDELRAFGVLKTSDRQRWGWKLDPAQAPKK